MRRRRSTSAAVRLAPGWTGPEQTLRGGVKYYRKMIEVFEEIREEEQDR
ncbi:MAG: hypothetical protein JST53_11485 [Actinobacteria bacterium]|nr:hypothetical protein [Actinomycetota bacterium]